MRRPLLLALLSSLLLSATATGTAMAAQSFFLSPSHNISCEIDSGSAVGTQAFCETFQPARSVTMSRSGTLKTCSGQNCLGDPPENAKTLAYGKSVHLGPFACVSQESGVRCTVRGRGFLISRSGVKRT